MSDYCKATGLDCPIEDVRLKSCMECIYLNYHKVYDVADLHYRIVKLFTVVSKTSEVET